MALLEDVREGKGNVIMLTRDGKNGMRQAGNIPSPWSWNNLGWKGSYDNRQGHG